jgi:hypothetical protein
MKTNRLSPATTLNRLIFKGWTVCGIALVSFAAGSLTTARLSHLSQVRADGNRVLWVTGCLGARPIGTTHSSTSWHMPPRRRQRKTGTR